MIIDPSWLYSTIAQSSAAIVAIIGGFITATVLTLNAERRSLKRQLELRRSQMHNLDEKIGKEIGNRARDLEKEKSLILAEAAETKFHIESFHTPRFIGLGVAFLAYLSVFGILLPIIVMGYELFNMTLRTWTIVLFCLGIIGIFGYIILLIRELRR